MINMIKNLTQLKKSLKNGVQYTIVENAIKPQNNGSLRTITKVQSNAVKAYVGNDTNSEIWLYWQKAKEMRFNGDGTIDFLLGSEMKDEWLIEQQAKEGKDYWLKVKFNV